MTLTRRDATKLALASAGAVALPRVAEARSNRAWARRLTKDMNRRLARGCDGRFSVTAFGQARRSDGQYHFAAIIRLDWPPGFRTRRYDGIKATENDAYDDLLAQALKHFRHAWPGCVT